MIFGEGKKKYQKFTPHFGMNAMWPVKGHTSFNFQPRPCPTKFWKISKAPGFEAEFLPTKNEFGSKKNNDEKRGTTRNMPKKPRGNRLFPCCRFLLPIYQFGIFFVGSNWRVSRGRMIQGGSRKRWLMELLWGPYTWPKING